MKKAIVGIVDTSAQADSIIVELQRLGFANEQISILYPDKAARGDVIHKKETKAPEGTVIGGASLGAIGGTLGLLIGLGALVIPGLGPFVAAGPLMAALSGAAVGGVVGGVAGALIGMGIPEVEAKFYEGKLRSGNFLVAIHTESSDEAKRARDVFKRFKAYDITAVNETTPPKDVRARS
jgi:hypothetical protein